MPSLVSGVGVLAVGYERAPFSCALDGHRHCLVASFLSQFGMMLCCVSILPAAFWGYELLAYSLEETTQLNPGSV